MSRPHDMRAERAAQRYPGFAHTAGGRQVYDTGKVLIGIESPRPPSPHSDDANRIQAALLAQRAHGAPARGRMLNLVWCAVCILSTLTVWLVSAA